MPASVEESLTQISSPFFTELPDFVPCGCSVCDGVCFDSRLCVWKGPPHSENCVMVAMVEKRFESGYTAELEPLG